MFIDQIFDLIFLFCMESGSIYVKTHLLSVKYNSATILKHAINTQSK